MMGTGLASQWVPVALRWYFMIIPISLSFFIGLGSILLHWQSHTSKGLCPETTAVFGWKFIPTLVTVIYKRFTAVLLENVQQTEPFAKMAKPSSSVPGAAYTILGTSKLWWITLATGLRKNRNDGTRSWVLVLCCTAYTLAILVISPLSATLLGIKLIPRPTAVLMKRAIPIDGSNIKFWTDRGTFLRTTAALLQNYSSSPWVTDEYFILPFWPSDLGGLQWSPRYSVPQLWEAETHVFQADLHCSRLELSKTDAYLRHATPDEHEQERSYDQHRSHLLFSMQLEATKGCVYNLTFNASNTYQYRTGFGSWTNINHFSNRGGHDEDARVILGQRCLGDESIILSTGWCSTSSCEEISENVSAVGYVCNSSYRVAKIPVQVSLTETTFAVDFDENQFRKVRNFTMALDFFRYVPQPTVFENLGPERDDILSPFQGATALLGAIYAQNLTAMIEDLDFPYHAARMRRRLFGEMLQTTVSSPGALTDEAIEGRRVLPERRIVVSMPVAAVLCGLSLLSFTILLSVLWILRSGHRDLNSFCNPNTTAGIISLVASNANVLTEFKALNQCSRSDLERRIGNSVFATWPGNLFKVQRGVGIPLFDPERKLQLNQTRAFIQKKRTLIGLLLLLVLMQVALAVLYHYTEMSNISASFFTYRVDLEDIGMLGSFSPFSIVPTLCAVSVTMWWEAVEKSCRELQPLIAMTQAPSKISKGLNLSYGSSLWFFVSAKALHNRHWILASITFGSFLTQVLTVTLSTVFKQSDGIRSQSFNVNRSLELRRQPHARTVWLTSQLNLSVPSFDPDDETYVSLFLQDILGNLESNWLYTALIERLFDGPEPPWSKDDWSFTPLDLSDVSGQHTMESSGDDKTKGSASRLTSGANITLETTAVRARLVCSRVQESKDPRQWISLLDSHTLPTIENFSSHDVMYVMNKTIFQNTNHWTTATSHRAIPICCTNSSYASNLSNPLSPVAFGYWTMNYPSDLYKYQSALYQSTGNFTIKWITATAGVHEKPHLYYSDILAFTSTPEMQSLNCQPVIESAPASVVVDHNLGNVQSYLILQNPQSEDVAWSDFFTLRDKPAYVSLENTSTRTIMYNLTTSYGPLFINTILRASNQYLWSRSENLLETDFFTGEGNTNEAYNIHDTNIGINVDFMSYASYKRTGKEDPAALLDHQTLLEQSQITFSTFFKHFMNSNMFSETGVRAYQRFGSNLVLPPPVQSVQWFNYEESGEFPGSNSTQRYPSAWNIIPAPKAQLPNGDPAPRFEDVPPHYTSPNATATLAERVQVLKFNRIAFWLAIGILAGLTTIMVGFIAKQQHYLGGLIQNVECIADKLVLIAGSDQLLTLVREKGIVAIVKEDKIHTRLGWFEDSEGKKRWGIEVAAAFENEMGEVPDSTSLL